MTTTIPHTFSVGDGATECVGSDRYAGTVVQVSRTGHAVWVQTDTATMSQTEGGGYFSDNQVWNCKPNPNGRITKFTRRRNGFYYAVGTNYVRLVPGRHHRMDPSF